MKKKFFKPPAHVLNNEAAALYEQMALGSAIKSQFLDRRNQIIFDTLIDLQKQTYCPGSEELIAYLAESNLLEAVGGIDYVQKVFCGLEPSEVA